ncbi:Protein SENSITIVITY TO RED LIGHT REDUCED 1 [Linum perenne]
MEMAPWSLANMLNTQFPRSMEDCGESVSSSKKIHSEGPYRLLYCSSKGDRAGVIQELNSGVLPNLSDYDKRTALHLASSEGRVEIVRLLIEKGASVNSLDRWGRTPLSDARSFGHVEICKILESGGGIDPVGLDSQTPCYEIHYSEVDMHNATLIGEGSLYDILRKKGRLDPQTAVAYALDIARGMNYLHRHKPHAIVHRDLTPRYHDELFASASFGCGLELACSWTDNLTALLSRNVLLDESGHLKVTDFGLSKIGEQKDAYGYKMTGGTGSYRYMAPEVYRRESYGKSVDVFSFALIFHELFRGGPSNVAELPEQVADKRAYEDARPSLYSFVYPEAIKSCCSRKERPAVLGQRLIRDEAAGILSAYIMDSSAKAVTLDKSAQNDGWTIVLPRSNRRSKRIPKLEPLEEQGRSWAPADNESDEDRQSKLMQKMAACMKRVENSAFGQKFMEQMQSQEIQDRFHKVLGSEQKMQMVIYGIGSIESHETPRLQLSIALLMKMNSSWIGDVQVFDPVLSATECRVLRVLGCSVLYVNEQGQRRATKPTLFYMPHCEAGLYNNLLRANWEVETLKRVALFGNSFRVYQQYASFKNLVLVDSSHIVAVEGVTDEFAVSTVWEEYFAGFHDSSWHFFRPSADEDLQLLDRK